jgi:hypothetical protein
MKPTKLRRTKKPNDPPDDSFLKVNKLMLRAYGPEVAVFMSNLIDKYRYWEEHGKLIDGSFYYPYRAQAYDTCTSNKILRKCKEIAVLNKLLTTHLKGSPAREYYEINWQSLDIQPVITKSNHKELQKVTTRSYKKELHNKENLKEEPINDFNEKITPTNFDLFMGIYPKVGKKGTAKAAWNKICALPIESADRPAWSDIQAAVERQRKSPAWRQDEGKWIPEAHTWLKNYGWLNDPKAMLPFTKALMKDAKPPKISAYGQNFYLDDDGEYYNKEGRRYT